MNRQPSRLLVRLTAMVVALVLAACLPPPVVIPPGAPTVHVTVTDDSVALAPSTVPAGDVYFVIEGPSMGFSFVRRMDAPNAEPTGMTQAQIDAIARGDFQSTMLEGIGVSCGEDEWTEERHWQGCRENSVMTLSEGLYAALGSGGEEPGVPPIMDVLEVVP
jgi:hypothetical protein